MKVWIEDVHGGRVETIFEYDNPTWVRLEFAHFTLRVSEVPGGAVISSVDVSLAVYPKADSQVEIVRR